MQADEPQTTLRKHVAQDGSGRTADALDAAHSVTTHHSCDGLPVTSCRRRQSHFSHHSAASRGPVLSAVCYRLAQGLIRTILSMTMRMRTRNTEAHGLTGGYLLACSHVSHLDPFCLGAILPERVQWMARIEFFRRRWLSSLLRLVGTFPVNRQGVPVSTVRTALARLGAGENVGLFVEGEIKRGRDSVLRGGRIKRGVCLLAARSGRPVVPCIILGTDKLNHPGPWLPWLRGRLWVICGEAIAPVIDPDRRAARAELAVRIEQAFVRLYAEAREAFGLPEDIAP